MPSPAMTTPAGSFRPADPLGPPGMHVLHCYFSLDPRCPADGRVLAFLSKAADAERGDIALLDPEAGQVDVLAADLVVEDAHRQAAQQFVAGGRWVVFHHLAGTTWLVEAVETATGKRRVLARNCQVGFSNPRLDIVPLMPLHWCPGPTGGVTLLRVSDGQVTRTVGLDAVVTQVGTRLPGPLPGDGQGSFYSPALSPDGHRLMMKFSRPRSGRMRDAAASDRWGLIAFDLRTERVLVAREQWGHPTWHPDARHILTVERSGLVLIDSDTGVATDLKHVPREAGMHPSLLPDGRTIVTDFIRPIDGLNTWHVGRADLHRPGLETLLPCGPVAAGTSSWRQAHPHPVSDRAGQFLYFNSMTKPWVRLHRTAL